jgi:PTS system fructose-specific IIC component
MTNPTIISSDLVLLDVDAGPDKEAVIGRLAGLLAADGRAADARGLTRAALDR